MRKGNGNLTEEQLEAMAEGKLQSEDFFESKSGRTRPGFDKIERRQKLEAGIQRVNVDFVQDMLAELDQMCAQLNISRQAVIKMLLRAGLDQHYLAIAARKRA